MTAAIGGEERIVWVDAATGDIRDLFVDSAAPTYRLRPVTWSPNGKFLLITNARVRTDNVMLHDLQLCVITREGILIACMAEVPLATVSSVNANQEDTARTFTWSADSRLVYYTSNAQGKLRLLEADAMTGSTLRVLHEAPIIPRGGTLTWTKDLRFIGEDLGAEPYSASKVVPQLVERLALTRQSVVNLPEAITNKLYYSVILSPIHGYITVRNHTNSEDETLEIIDLTGNVLHKIEGTDSDGAWSELRSPAWSPDESTLYFRGAGEQYPSGIYAYHLPTQKLSSAYLFPPPTDPPSRDGVIFNFFAVSPDNTAIAGNGEDAPPYGGSQVRVVYFDGTSEVLLGRYSRTLFPLWVPPVTP